MNKDQVATVPQRGSYRQRLTHNEQLNLGWVERNGILPHYISLEQHGMALHVKESSGKASPHSNLQEGNTLRENTYERKQEMDWTMECTHSLANRKARKCETGDETE